MEQVDLAPAPKMQACALTWKNTNVIDWLDAEEWWETPAGEPPREPTARGLVVDGEWLEGEGADWEEEVSGAEDVIGFNDQEDVVVVVVVYMCSQKHAH